MLRGICKPYYRPTKGRAEGHLKDILEVTIETNQKIVNFLDITMNLEEGNFKPYIKPKTTPLYIDSQSNHPPSTIKNLPASINKRLSSILSIKVEFNITKRL